MPVIEILKKSFKIEKKNSILYDLVYVLYAEGV